VDGTGSVFRPMAGFGTSNVEAFGSTTREIIRKLDLSDTGCKDGRWMELAQYRV